MQKTASKDLAFQAFRILQVAFAIVPIAAGLDKFFHLLTNWTKYLSPMISKTVAHHDEAFMMVVGAVEIIVGLGIIFKPKLFAYIVAVWLFLTALNLLMLGGYFDTALRDVGMALGAIAFGRLSQKYT